MRLTAYGQRPRGCYVEKQREMTFSTPVSTTFLSLKSIFDYHIDSLEVVKVPALLLVGERDRLTNTDGNRRTAELLPEARLEVFPTSGHNSLLERWAEYNEQLEGFLGTVFSSA